VERHFDHMDDLIGKVLAGEATDAEVKAFEVWISSNTENREYYQQMKTIFEKAATVKEWLHFDADAAWNNLKGKLKKKESKTIPLKPTFWKPLRIAAGVLVVLGAGYVAFQWSKKVPVETIAVAAETAVVRDTLPDGSLAVLNKNSSLTYEYNTKDNKRKVKLQGEAFFEVQHQEEKPFVIETDEVIIEDIGTTFNVMAFPESPTIEVYVETGEVAFYTTENPGLNLKAGETGVYHRQSKSFARLLKTDTNLLAYKTGVFNFHNTDLTTIVHDLNEVYETKLRLANDEMGSCRLNVSFKNEKMEAIAEIIAETLNLAMTINDKEIVLDGTGCGN
jgi:ferric-dicitrate binding protein FerR (iron transport regulator)